MGQMTYAVLYGVKMRAPKELGEEGWWELTERYACRPNAAKPNPDRPCGDSDFEGIGFWCAVGASGERGVPDLAGFPLDNFDASEKHEKALSRAKGAWVRFATWCEEPHSGGKGERAWKTPAIKFPQPRLFLVQTEVA